jgi:hypothetical protein
MPAQGWTEHAGELVPIVVNIGEILIWLIGILGGLLLTVLTWIGRGLNTRFNSMEVKLDHMHSVMLLCDGCASAAKEHKRRSTDLEV